MIQFEHVRKQFGRRVVLKDVSFTINESEIFFIIGTSGVGKSVLIKQLVGLLRPDGGEIHYKGQPLSKLSEREFYPVRKECSLVFQNSTLVDSMSCAENVAFPLRKHQKLSRSAARKRALELLARVHMQEHADEHPSSLGDGMRKRVAVARALSFEPRVILFDEPTTSLDPISARRIDQLIVELAREQGVTCVVVSHDLESINGIADRVAMLYEGVVRAVGTVEELLGRSDPVIEQFLRGKAEGPLITT